MAPQGEIETGLPPHRNGEARHLRQIVAGVSDGVILIDLDQTILWANKAALEMHGVVQIEDLGSTVAEYRERFELRYRNRHRLPAGQYPMERVMAGEAFDEVVVEVVPAGRDDVHWTHRIRSLVLDGRDGEPARLVLVLHDETERYRAEERFEKAFAANPAPAVISRLDDLRHVRVNRGFLEMTGYREEDVIGRSIYEVDLLEGAKRRELGVERLHDGRTIPQMEATLQLPGGGEKAVIVAGQPIEVDDVRCMLFTFADLDGRRQAEAALRQSEERFATAFRMSPVPTLLATRTEGRVLMVNEAFLRESGYQQAEVVGRDGVDLQLWTDPQASVSIERLLRTGGRVLDLRLSTKDGGALDCLVGAEAVEIHGQDCVLLTAQNVTERKRTHVEVADAISTVMRDTAWFTDAVLEQLARSRLTGGNSPVGSGLGELPPRAREVLGLVCQGLDDAEIGRRLGLSRVTARNHVGALYKRTGVRNRAALVVWARERGIDGPRPR